MANSIDAQKTLLDGETVPAADLRRELFGALFPGAGIVRGLQAVSTPTPSMKVRLPSGTCVVDDGTGGFVPLSLLAQTDLDIAASSTTLARIDSVIAEVVDTGVAGTLIRRFRVITGTPAASPVAPPLPPADQPTAKTLRLADVFVQASAETNGNVRPQDVTVAAPGVSVTPRPVKTDQVANPNFDVTGSAVDFSTGKWPAATFTVPPSGMVYVTISAALRNTSNSIWATYRMSGGFTLSTRFEDGGLSANGDSRVYASRRKLYAGLPAGASVTVTPQWFIFSGDASTCTLTGGQLVIEPVG